MIFYEGNSSKVNIFRRSTYLNNNNKKSSLTKRHYITIGIVIVCIIAIIIVVVVVKKNKDKKEQDQELQSDTKKEDFASNIEEIEKENEPNQSIYEEEKEINVEKEKEKEKNVEKEKNAEKEKEKSIEKEKEKSIEKENEKNVEKEKEKTTEKEEIQEEEEDDGNEIFPLNEELKSEVMEIYNNIGMNDKETLATFCEYLSTKAPKLKNKQKVYLAYYWIIKNIEYKADTFISTDPEIFFSQKKTSSGGFSNLFKRLLEAMNYEEENILIILGYAKNFGYSPLNALQLNHVWNAVKINKKWCLIDTVLDSSSNSEFYLCPSPSCFIRDHLPLDNKRQFLENPITEEQFHSQVHTYKSYCKYNMEIIEDKAIQNICGRTKIIIKYESDKVLKAEIGRFNDAKMPSYWIYFKENELEIDISVNDKDISQIFITLTNVKESEFSNIGYFIFNCNEEPINKFYFPSISSYYRNSDTKLISPLERDLKKGQKYTFEIESTSFDILEIWTGEIYDEKIYMTKNGNVFKEENVLIHSDKIEIYCNDGRLVSFRGVGNDIDYPNYRYNGLKIRLLQPYEGTILKEQEYTFKIRSETNEKFFIVYGSEKIEMNKEGNIYSTTILLDSTITESDLFIKYQNTDYGFLFYEELYKYKIQP